MSSSAARLLGTVLVACVVAGGWGCGSRRTTVPPPPPAAVPPQPLFIGAGSCTSSGCHAAPVAEHAPWQSSYTVWSTRDPHARSHDVLQGPLAARIVAALALREPHRPQLPARENMACVGCHATARGPNAGEGVSCESCHGPAGPWLVAHAAKGWTTRGNRLGMIDLADPFTCATTCAECHVGGEPTADGAIREVTHDLVAAGHPRLAFELRDYKRAEPPHWRDRLTMPADVATPDPFAEWAAGRLATLTLFLRQLASQAEAARTGQRGLTCGVWPEFTAFDCHGCHRPAALVTPSTPRSLAAPGSPRLEPMYWSHLDLVLPAAEVDTLTQLRGGIDRGWARMPDPQPLAAAVRAVEAARTGLHERISTASAGELAARLVAGTNVANWAEVVSALGGLEALADREMLAGRTAVDGDVRLQLAELRTRLEFPIESAAGQTVRFSSPRRYDAAAVSEQLRVIAETLSRVTERVGPP